MSEPVGDDITEKFAVKSRSISLERGSRVSVGYSTESDCTFVRLTNNQGSDTRFRISPEATDALLDLLKMGRAWFDNAGAEAKGVWKLVEFAARGIAAEGEDALAASSEGQEPGPKDAP